MTMPHTQPISQCCLPNERLTMASSDMWKELEEVLHLLPAQTSVSTMEILKKRPARNRPHPSSQSRRRKPAGTTSRRKSPKAAMTTTNQLPTSSISKFFPSSSDCSFMSTSIEPSFISNTVLPCTSLNTFLDAPVDSLNTLTFPSISSNNIVVPLPIAEPVQNIQELPLPFFLNPSDYVNDVFDHFIAPTITGEAGNIHTIRVYMYKKLVLEIFQQSTATTPISEFSQIVENCISALSRADLLRNLL